MPITDPEVAQYIAVRSRGRFVPLSVNFPNLLGKTDEEIESFLNSHITDRTLVAKWVWDHTPTHMHSSFGWVPGGLSMLKWSELRSKIDILSVVDRIHRHIESGDKIPITMKWMRIRKELENIPRFIVERYLQCVKMYDRDLVYTTMSALGNKLARSIWNDYPSRGVSPSRDALEYRIRLLGPTSSISAFSFVGKKEKASQIYSEELKTDILNSIRLIFITTPTGGLEMLSVFGYANSLRKPRMPGFVLHESAAERLGLLTVRPYETKKWEALTIKAKLRRAKAVGMKRVIAAAQRIPYDLLDYYWTMLGDEDRRETYAYAAFETLQRYIWGSKSYTDKPRYDDYNRISRMDLSDFKESPLRRAVVAMLMIEFAELKEWPADLRRELGGWYPDIWMKHLPTYQIDQVVIVDDIIASGEQMMLVEKKLRDIFGPRVKIWSVHLAVRDNPHQQVKTVETGKSIYDVQTIGIRSWFEQGMPLDKWVTAMFPHACPDGTSDALLHQLYGYRCSPKHRIEGD